MTIAQITAILSILMAFGVPQVTVNQVHDILIPSTASTTSITNVPVVITPIVENQPVYFGSIQPVISPVISPLVDKSEIKVVSIRMMDSHFDPRNTPFGQAWFFVAVLDSEGKNEYDANVTMTSSDGIILTRPTSNSDKAINNDDWKAYLYYIPKSAGDKDITFTSGDLTKTITVTF